MQPQSSTNTGLTCDDTTTCEPSRQHTHTHRISASISSAAASHAKTSASPARVQDSQERGQVFGTILLGSFAQFGPDGWSSRTSQLSLLEGSEPFSETWPKSGLMRNGIAYRLQPLVRRTDVRECGLWATPVANQSAAASLPALLNEAKRLHLRRQWTLATQVAAEHTHGYRMWPTPKAASAGPDFAKTTRSKTGISLATAAAMFPTPTVQDASNNGGPSQHKRNSLPLNAVAGGSLNPTWVEWLMGFPLGWTALDASATPSSRKSSRSSGGRSLQRKRG
jgi:hypothetical protein